MSVKANIKNDIKWVLGLGVMVIVCATFPVQAMGTDNPGQVHINIVGDGICHTIPSQHQWKDLFGPEEMLQLQCYSPAALSHAWACLRADHNKHYMQLADYVNKPDEEQKPCIINSLKQGCMIVLLQHLISNEQTKITSKNLVLKKAQLKFHDFFKFNIGIGSAVCIAVIIFNVWPCG